MFDTLARLPGVNSASVLRQLSWLHLRGVSAILPGRVQLSWKNHFKVFAPQKHFSVGFADGVVLHGFWKEAFDGTYYIHRLQHIREGRCMESGEWYVFSSIADTDPAQDLTLYQEMPLDWLEEQQDKPWSAKGDKELNFFEESNATMSMYMEEACFYRYVWDIYDVAALAKAHGSHPPWLSSSVCQPYPRAVFNAAYRHAPDRLTLQEMIVQCLEPSKTLVFVQFKDEQDELCQAQEAFLNMMSLYLTQQHNDLSIIRVDVIIRDTAGARPYETEWHEYFDKNMLGLGGSTSRTTPSPFVMVLGQISPGAMDHVTSVVRTQGMRLLDFDLFHECRDLLREKRECNWNANQQFHVNLKRAMHEIWRVAGMVGNSAYSTPKDYKGCPEPMVKQMIWDLEDHAVIIKIHTKKKGPAQTVLQLCNHLKSSGCPYVEVVLCDGPEDILEVHDDTDIYSEFTLKDDSFTDAKKRETLFWTVEQVVRRKYAGHKLNGASPLLLRPEPEPRPSQKDRVPDIFRDLKKPLH